MRSSYKIGHFSDGTRMKISYRLCNEIKQWIKEDEITLAILDEPKIQKTGWINYIGCYCANSIYADYSDYESLRKEKSHLANSFKIAALIIFFRIFLLNLCIYLKIQRFIMLGFYNMELLKKKSDNACLN